MFARLQQIGLTPARLVLIASGFISMYFGVTIFGNALHQYQLDRQNTQLEQRILVAQHDGARLKALRDWMQSDDFVETMARQQGLVKPGDHQILVAAPTPASTPVATGQWWERYLEP